VAVNVLDRVFREKPVWFVPLVSLASIAVLGWLDYVTGPEYSFAIFYLLPIGVASWYAPRRVALPVAVVASAVWIFADAESLGIRLPIHVEVWNAIIRASLFAVVTWTLSSARESVEREAALARRIQRGLLPSSIPSVRGIEIAWEWKPARSVSGDYFDVLEDPNGVVTVCIADVAGKGLSAAILMANFQAAVRSVATAGFSPAELCARLNTFVAGNVPPDRFITCFVAQVLPGEGTLRFTNAGHNPPLLVRSGGAVERLERGGLALGILDAAVFEEGETRLGRGDRLVLFTDGVTEVTDRQREEFGDSRLAEAITSRPSLDAAELLRSILEAIERFRSGPFADDVTLAVIRSTGSGTQGKAAASVPPREPPSRGRGPAR
jgi:serine phosphatase RsbU (regulator of sigma subunit)